MKHNNSILQDFSIRRRLQPKERFDRGALAGLFLAFATLAMIVIFGKNFSAFLDPGSFILVFIGTLAATLITYPLGDLRRTCKTIRAAFDSDGVSTEDRLEKLLDLAKRARSEGALSLEREIYKERDPFLLKCIQLLVDGLKPEDLRRTLDIELSFSENRYKHGAEILNSMGTIAPAMGLIGTLIGLVQMLENLENPSAIGPAMGLALLTTFYGAVLANLLFYPLSAKLTARGEEENRIKEMTIEGILCILDGLNPRLMEQRLFSFIAPQKRLSQYGAL